MGREAMCSRRPFSDPCLSPTWRGMAIAFRPSGHLGSENPTGRSSMERDVRIQAEAAQLEASWRAEPRWNGIERTYGAADVIRLRGSVVPEQTIARLGAERLWELLHRDEPARALGALTGGQAVQMVKAGLEAIYLSGWQVAADGNLAAHTYPDQSLYPANSAPALVRRLNRALLRADQVSSAEGDGSTDWLVPIVADGEAGFGGPLHAFELMKSMI